MKIIKFFIIIFFILNNLTSTEPGMLDKKFGKNGFKKGTINKKFLNFSQINSLLLNLNNKIIATGFTSKKEISHFALAKFHLDGNSDINFNKNGKLGPKKGIVITKIGYTSTINSAAINNENKIIVCGTSRLTRNSFEQITIACYNQNGTLNKNFNSAKNLGPKKGVVIKDLWLTSSAHALAIDSNNKILVAGSTWNTQTGHDLAILRFNKDGELDKTFNRNGKIPGVFSININDFASRAQSIAIDKNGKIIVAGYSGLGFTILRCNPNGTLDKTFNATGPIPGVFTTIIGHINPTPTVRSIAIASDGKIYAVGTTTLGFTLFRLNQNGTLDTSFNSTGPIAGVVTTNINNSAQSYSVSLDANERIFVNGFSTRNNNLQVFTIASYLKNGQLNNEFNSKGPIPGISTIRIGQNSSSFCSRIIKKDQRILVGGYGNNNFAIAKYII